MTDIPLLPGLPNLIFSRGSVLWALLLVPLVVLLPARLGRTTLRPAVRWLRGAVLALLIVSLAGPLATVGSAEATTVFVVDRSYSVGPGATDGINRWVTEALGAADAEAQASIVTFGADPTLTSPARAAAEIDGEWRNVPTNDPNREVTDLASALALSRSLPVGEGRRIVVLSDGSENAGRAVEQAEQAAREGVPIDVLPVPGVGEGDLRIETVSGPTALWTGDDLSVLANVASGAGGEAVIELAVDGVVHHSEAVTLQPGTAAFTLTAPELSPGFHAIEVRVSGQPEIDPVPQNNRVGLAVVVRDEPALLLVAPEGADSTRLNQAFTNAGASVTIVAPADVPLRLSELSTYDSIVLNNVPAWTLSDDQQAALVARARAGGSLIVVGGAASYGPGGYASTPLEAALPVTVKVTDGTQRPKVALLLIIDKSGSMTYDPGSGTHTKLEMAQEAVRQAAGALTTGDQVGVIAFNDEPQWLLPMMTLNAEGDRERINAAVSQLTADGGTELYPAMQVGYDQMRNIQADVRHIVLISDGKSQSGSPESYQRLVADVGNDNITLSAIAIGNDADIELLQSLAVEGHGRYHQAVTPADIPRLTLEEARSAGSQSVLRGAFQPIQQSASPIMRDITPQDLPPLDGYDFAEARPDAQVVLTSDRADPVLATWQLGLGRVVAWTADDGGDFAAQWEGWTRYDEFWGNTLRWSLPDPTNGAVRVAAERRGSDVVVALDAVTPGGDAIDLGGATITITAPDGSAVTTQTLTSTAPGRAEIRLPRLAAGAYQVSLTGTNGSAIGDVTGFAVPPSPEWQPNASGRDLLTSLATITGGRVFSLDTPAPDDLFRIDAATGAPGRVRPVWQAPLTAALTLFLIEIALRLGVLRWPLPRAIV